ncbi:MAG: LysE family transporter [Pseudomonadota bacterium]
MEIAVLIKGLILGLVVCAPVGPIGLLCFKRALTDGPRAGVASVLGAACADLVYCLMAGFGISFIGAFLVRRYVWFEIVGGLMLVALGLKVFFSPLPERDADGNGQGVLSAFTSTLVLAFTNPTLFLVFTAAFAALGVQGWRGGIMPTAVLVAGVFLGSALWAPILAGTLALFPYNLTERQLTMVNRAAGSALCLFGLIAGFSGVWAWQR